MPILALIMQQTVISYCYHAQTKLSIVFLFLFIHMKKKTKTKTKKQNSPYPIKFSKKQNNLHNVKHNNQIKNKSPHVFYIFFLFSFLFISPFFILFFFFFLTSKQLHFLNYLSLLTKLRQNLTTSLKCYHRFSNYI